MTDSTPLPLIRPDWPAPAGVRAAATTRRGGVSRPPFDELNLGLHGGDDPAQVRLNRSRLAVAAGLPGEPVWLDQVHGAEVVNAAAVSGRVRADAAWSDQAGVVCAVLTADCLPLLLCSRRGDRVAAVHAGWRGFGAGVIENAVAALALPGADLLAWLGPAISQAAYEVGADVHAALAVDRSSKACFRDSRPGHWHLDLYALARLKLARLGVTEVFGGDRCTHTEKDWFYSHRRDGPCGRMLSMVWLDAG